MIDEKIDPIVALKVISIILDNLNYECESSVYTLDEDAMGWIFYCRDMADICIKNHKEGSAI